MEENRRIWVLGGTVIVVVLVVLGGYLVFRGGPEHTLTVKSIPNDLTLTLDGQPVAANGDLKVKEGTHTLVGERRGFETHTQTVTVRGDTSLKVYLFSNGPEGREWEKEHPGEVLETETEAGRRHQELTDRLQEKYPILEQLPYLGPGFEVNYGRSKAHPGDPEVLAFYIRVFTPKGREKAEKWLRGYGHDKAGLEIIYTK